MEGESGLWEPQGWEPCALELPSHTRTSPVLWEDPSGDGDMSIGFRRDQTLSW